MSINIILIGIGPHTLRTYLPYFKKNNICPRIVVELESKRAEVKEIFNEYSNVSLLFLNDQYRDELTLPLFFKNILNECCKKHNITHAFIVTEPKAHMMYIQFCIDADINFMTEKPITAPPKLYTKDDADRVLLQYNEIVSKLKNKDILFYVMCQRRYHSGYELIFNVLKDVITKYEVPITNITIDHCDGNWIMPHDLFYENHPYKFGYGKLFHSGYHFVDLLCEFIKLNTLLNERKRPYYITTATKVQTFDDMNDIIPVNQILKLFPNEHPPAFYEKEVNIKGMGEMNIDSLVHVYNERLRAITAISLSIKQMGFSRRGWFNTKSDHYKGNGRIRHESISIQVGPLMNIRVSSYQSKQMNERTQEEFQIGGLDHFDIDFFRNVDVIGGEPYSRITAENLLLLENQNHKGLNEEARDKCLSDFLSEHAQKIGSGENHKLAMKLMHSLCLATVEKEQLEPIIDSFYI